MPEQLSKIRNEESPDPSKQKAKDEGLNWTTEEKQSCLQEYGCEILVDNGSSDDVRIKKAPTDACIIKYTVDDKVCFDLTRGSKYKLFDMYYDKFKGGIQSIEFGYGTIKPNMWGYKQPEKKKRRK